MAYIQWPELGFPQKELILLRIYIILVQKYMLL